MSRPLSAEERAAVKAVAERVAKAEGGFEWSFDDLLEQWRRFVHDVATGHEETADDYSLGLYRRDQLSRIVSGVSEPIRRKLIARIEPADVRFRKNTYELAAALLPSTEEQQTRWWYSRAPKKAGDEFREDLQDEISRQGMSWTDAWISS